MATVSVPITTTTATVFTTSDVSCTALKNSVASVNSLYKVLACSADDLQVGTAVLYTTAASRSAVYYSNVTAVSGEPPAIPYPVTLEPLFQAAANTLDTTAGELVVKDAFGTATPEQYQAISAIFGLVICALAIVWGVRQVLRSLNSASDA